MRSLISAFLTVALVAVGSTTAQFGPVPNPGPCGYVCQQMKEMQKVDSAQPLLRTTAATKTEPTARRLKTEGSTTCNDSPGTAVFDKFLDAGANRNMTRMEELISDDFLFRMPGEGLQFNKTGFLNFLTGAWAGKGIDFLWPSTRMTSDSVGVALVRYGGFENTTPNSPISSQELFMFYQTTPGYEKISLFVELLHTGGHKTHQYDVTKAAWTAVSNAFISANSTALSKAFSSEPIIYDLPCDATSVASITKHEFVKQAMDEYATQINAHVDDHKMYINDVWAAVHSTAYLTRHSASGLASQVLVEQVTMYSVNEVGHIDRFFSFKKMWYGA